MKKGFSLIELLASLVIISITMIFITSFVVDIRREKVGVFFNTNERVNSASIVKILNEDALKYGISSIEKSSARILTINYNNGKVGKIEIFYDGENTSLKYTVDNEIESLKTFKNRQVFGINYNKNDPRYYKLYDVDNDGQDDHVFFNYNISTPSGIEVYYYGSLS